MMQIWIDGEPAEVAEHISVAAALQRAGADITRWSVTGEARAPFCGMGVCQECRVEIDGVRRLACQTTVRENMRIERVHNEAAITEQGEA